MLHAAAVEFMPGSASPVQTEDLALFDRVVDLASADYDGFVPPFLDTHKFIGDPDDVETGVEIHHLPENAILAAELKDES